jgi:hypothetical protein
MGSLCRKLGKEAREQAAGRSEGGMVAAFFSSEEGTERQGFWILRLERKRRQEDDYGWLVVLFLQLLG